MPTISVQGDTNVHGGAPFDKGLSPNVNAGNKPIAEAGVTGSNENDTLYNENPQGHPQGIAANQTAAIGSSTVFANNKPVHRVGDARVDGSTAGPGINSVNVG